MLYNKSSCQLKKTSTSLERNFLVKKHEINTRFKSFVTICETTERWIKHALYSFETPDKYAWNS